MKKTLNHYHLEEVLLFVKNEMGKKRVELLPHEGKIFHGIQQMPSVVSQMRGRIIFGTD